MKSILITGGTGLIGLHLSRLLKSKGYNVFHLSRKGNPKAEFPAYKWDIKEQFIEEGVIEKADAIIHLAGASLVQKRWSTAYKKEMIESRTHSLQLLKKHIANRPTPLKTFVSASAVGFYGNTGDKWLKETDPPPQGDKDFKSHCCVLWENAAKELEPLVSRLAIIRVGIVLSSKGGALEKMMLSFKAKTGSYFGDGSAYYPWIHIEDMCQMFVYALEKEQLSGIYNGVAPNPVPNKEFIQTIPKAMGISALILPTPEFVIRLAMGEMSAVVLDSNRVSAQKILDSGFKFKHPLLLNALKDVLTSGV